MIPRDTRGNYEMNNTQDGLYYYKGHILPRGIVRMLEDNPTTRLLTDDETSGINEDVLQAYYKGVTL